MLNANDACERGELVMPRFISSSSTDIDHDGCRDAGEDRDDDSDTVADAQDNCPVTANATQLDADADGIGDACDACTDQDRDGICIPADQCPTQAEDFDGDADADGCPETSGPVCADVTGDGRVTAADVLQVTLRVGARRGRPRYEARYDFDNSGLIDLSDVAFALAQLGRRC